MTIQEALSKIIEGFHGIGNFASIVLTLIAFWGVISKKPKEKLK
jgi:heme/copper-type cytochrome/quinol oxidase subunit 4